MSMRLSSTATLKTFRQIFRNGMSPPSVNIYNFRIRGFAGAGNFESESALIVARCKEKKVREAFGLWKAMTDKGVEPNLVSSNAVIQGLCEEERIEEAEEVVEEMNRKGLTPDENTYMSLFQLLCDRCEADKAYKVLSEMIVRGMLVIW
ncbi:pentatricopeptide repeat-containing protein At5g39710-like isoform X3 [Lotus japonicus]|uniref:pentatricopeptide repeat-containing protein At5g39710-like isoform X3 n=1 Tax=Lotus japonicus TaxID=34305 RepID=UPI00258FBF28|nr:pentatricopeptide repeat-containing protein At5g39710-like isoform X3 [Lotus japonicus]